MFAGRMMLAGAVLVTEEPTLFGKGFIARGQDEGSAGRCRSVGGDGEGSFSRSRTRVRRSSVQLLARNNASTTCVCLCECVEKAFRTDLMHAACCSLPGTLSHRWTKRQSCS